MRRTGAKPCLFAEGLSVHNPRHRQVLLTVWVTTQFRAYRIGYAENGCACEAHAHPFSASSG